MNKLQILFKYFTQFELVLWFTSMIIIILSFFIFDGINYITLIASLIGVTSLIFSAKGNPFGQFLMILFSLLYGIISYSFRYYGEMITYLGMTGPMAVFALIAWLKNPYEGKKSEVKVNELSFKEYIVMAILTIIITFIFYFILEHFDTANIIPSTISVTTSFLAVYLTFRRSHLYPLAYAANDVVLIVLWTIASFEDISYLSVNVCFMVFLVNDLYGYINWSKMKKTQSVGLENKAYSYSQNPIPDEL